jgi:hypothetical protein
MQKYLILNAIPFIILKEEFTMPKKTTPKNLKAALAESKKDNSDFNLSKVLEDDSNYKFSCLVSQLAKEFLGFSHSSDVLDSGEDSIRKFLGLKDSVDSNESSDSDESDSFNAYDHESDIKEKFKEKLDPVMATESYLYLPLFKEAFELAKKAKFKGTEQDFEAYLKTSDVFREFAKSELTKYTG